MKVRDDHTLSIHPSTKSILIFGGFVNGYRNNELYEGTYDSA
jgi:hypothetical protein